MILKLTIQYNTIQYNTIQICDYTKEEIIKIFRKFSKQIYNIYWFQKNSFLKIVNWKDRDTYILEVDWKQIWVLTFKTDLQKEDKILNLKNWYLEIKSFFLFDWFWKWDIWLLWKKLLDIIENEFNSLDWVYVTISRTKAAPSLSMFKKVWFKELYWVFNEYTSDNSIEEHLFLPINIKYKQNSFIIPIFKKYFNQIKNWQKTVEWRSWKSYMKYKKWDIIIFKNSWNSIKKKIKDVIRYANIEDFLQNEWVENCLPWVKNFKEAIKVYNKITWYWEKIKKFWIVAFKF